MDETYGEVGGEDVSVLLTGWLYLVISSTLIIVSLIIVFSGSFLYLCFSVTEHLCVCVWKEILTQVRPTNKYTCEALVLILMISVLLRHTSSISQATGLVNYLQIQINK